MTVAQLLARLNLAQLAPAFEAEGIDLEALALLDDVHLKELGVTRLGDRAKLREMARAGEVALSGATRMDPVGGDVSLSGATRMDPVGGDLSLSGATRMDPVGGDVSFSGATRMDPVGSDVSFSGATRMDPVGSDVSLSGATRMDPLGDGATRMDPLVVDAAPLRGLTMAGKAVDARALDLGALAAGTVFDGRYTIVECIGRGGMGAVYQAVDRETRQTVALKTLPSNDPRLFEALSREVALAAQLQHPNLLGVRHLETRGDAPYVVMELLDDGDLDAALRARGGKMGAEEALRTLDGVLAGLAALHAAGVVHLDLKPANVLLGKDGRVKLADFGISSRTRDQKAGSSGAATPEYASPEQVRGAPCDTRADVYAAGMLAHVLLAGRFPFEARDMNGVRAWHERGERRFPAVLPAVGEVLARALAVTPDERYRTADELQRALKGALVRKSWYTLADGAADALKGRLAARVRVPGSTGTLSDAEGMLRRGAARPGWRTDAGAVVLEAHALAARHVGASVKVTGALEAGAQALTGKGDALRDLAEQPAEVEAALALAAWLGGNEGLALRRLDVAQRRAAGSVGAHLAVATALRAGLGDANEVREAVQRAEAAAEKATDDAVVGWLEVAAFHRWVLGDRKGLTRTLGAAERASTTADNHLAVAQAHLAFGSEVADVDAVVGRFLAARGGDGSGMGNDARKGAKRDGATDAATLAKRADALVDAARALGPLACVRAAAEALQRSAGTDPDALDAARRAWDALGDAESAARTAEARTASLDAQWTKLLERLARIDVPAERPAGALSPAVLAKLAEYVEAQEAFARAARDLDARARAVLLPPHAWSRPYAKAEVTAGGEFLGVQERLQQRVLDLDPRAAAVHLPACVWVRPLGEPAVEARAREVVAQEARSNAAAALDAERAGLGLAAWAWTRAVAEDEVRACRADTRPWAERAAEVRARAERCREMTGWAPEAPAGPVDAAAVAAFGERVRAQEGAWARLEAVRSGAHAQWTASVDISGVELLPEVERSLVSRLQCRTNFATEYGRLQRSWHAVTNEVYARSIASVELDGAEYILRFEADLAEQHTLRDELGAIGGTGPITRTAGDIKLLILLVFALWPVAVVYWYRSDWSLTTEPPPAPPWTRATVDAFVSKFADASLARVRFWAVVRVIAAVFGSIALTIYLTLAVQLLAPMEAVRDSMDEPSGVQRFLALLVLGYMAFRAWTTWPRRIRDRADTPAALKAIRRSTLLTVAGSAVLLCAGPPTTDRVRIIAEEARDQAHGEARRQARATQQCTAPAEA